MMQTPVIVTFANQKGGVGKTTLCVTFANYLLTKGVNVVVVDCDSQHSILKCRRSDIRKYGEQAMPYDVVEREATDRQEMIELIEKLHNDPSIEVAVIDSPGSLKAGGLVPLFVNSDIIVIPFHYDLVTVPSTASFLMFLDRLRHAVGDDMKARLFIIPNLNDGRVGKRSELVIWDNTRETFSNYGYVTPKLPKRADMQRFSTVAALDMQLKIVEPVFDKIYSAIFDTTKPIRTSRLSGIQLVDNLNPKEKKTKGKADSPPENSTSPPATVETANLEAIKPDNENTSFESTQPEDTGDNEHE
ncbi:ParA family protein [uncultured Duncaniella sp.]|jgi:chromosome partitioning protein|uniref:ParA family protein n=1 Tax=uncultured Duncaniella sp. TaxID=2768039 RepID=UPI0025B08393|nr:ParA family protein [uncultured Duncaniella sp.]